MSLGWTSKFYNQQINPYTGSPWTQWPVVVVHFNRSMVSLLAMQVAALTISGRWRHISLPGVIYVRCVYHIFSHVLWWIVRQWRLETKILDLQQTKGISSRVWGSLGGLYWRKLSSTKSSVAMWLQWFWLLHVEEIMLFTEIWFKCVDIAMNVFRHRPRFIVSDDSDGLFQSFTPTKNTGVAETNM